MRTQDWLGEDMESGNHESNIGLLFWIIKPKKYYNKGISKESVIIY